MGLLAIFSKKYEFHDVVLLNFPEKIGVQTTKYKIGVQDSTFAANENRSSFCKIGSFL